MTFIHRASRSHRRRLVGDYNNLVLGTGPIAYWPQSEATGAISHCLVDPAQNGAYVGATLANDNTGPFGTPAPLFDGVNDRNNVLTAALQASFNGAEGSMMQWMKVFNVGIWTDAVARYPLSLRSDVNNQTMFVRSAVNNRMRWWYESGGVMKDEANSAMTTTDWFLMHMTWSETTNLIHYYMDGEPYGTPDANPQTWAGALTIASIGDYSASGTGEWHGWLGPTALWDRALPAGEVKSHYVT